LSTLLLLIKQRCALPRNEKGFTLIEALFALSVFSILIFYMTPMLQILLINIDSKPDIQRLEWEVFGSQVKKEIRSCSRAQVISGKLYLTKEPDTIVYEKYGNNLRRRLN
jgi:competence protein ComGF